MKPDQKSHSVLIRLLYLLSSLPFAFKLILQASHLILYNQQQSSAGTPLIRASQIQRLCWDWGSRMFCRVSCLVWDKAPLLRDLHLSVCRQCIRPDKFTYGGGGEWREGLGRGEMQLYSSSIVSRQRNAASSWTINNSHCILRRLTKEEGRKSCEGETGVKEKNR